MTSTPAPVTGAPQDSNFTRNATGLVREVSMWDALIMNTLGMNVAVGSVLLLQQAPAIFPGGNLWLAVIIGKRARSISKEQALDYVAGYACFHDASVRDWQRHTSQWTPGKNFLGTGPLGPWMVTKDQIPDPTQLTMVMRLNGKEMQHTTTDLMIFSIPTLIQYITSFTELVPGDVIATGTPGGVGFKRTPPVFMKPGDVAEVEITGIGVLRNPVMAAK